MTNEIQHILSGTSQVKHHHLIQTACSYLKGSQGASSMDKNQQQRKEEETKRLMQFVNDNNLWVDNINHCCPVNILKNRGTIIELPPVMSTFELPHKKERHG